MAVRTKFCTGKECQALEEVIQESVWVIIPGRILKVCRCDTYDIHVLVMDMTVLD